MRRTAVVITAIFFLVLNGCILPRSARQLTSLPPHKKLAAAVSLIQKDDAVTAIKLLEEITSMPPVPGVTDEALFRLALLQLGSELDKAKVTKTKQSIKRLTDEYPESPWSGQAKQLDRFLIKVVKVVDEGSDLKRDMKKLKSLDLELDRRGMK